jgi:NADPH:quinone reductase-like Zn-dependent oxidoreductase
MEAMQIKQVVMVGKRQVELQTLSLDEKLGADEFLVRTECSFISAGTELAIYTAKEESALQKGSWCAYPWRAGYANVGVVEAVGPAVTRVVSGQRVFSLGAHVSHFKCGQDAFVVAVPDGLESGVAAVVTDDRHFNAKSGDDIRDGDAMQLGVAPSRGVHWNLALALTTNGVACQQLAGGSNMSATNASYAVVRDEAARVTRYEVSLPLATLGVKPGDSIGFNIMFMDADDGKGQIRTLTLAPGMPAPFKTELYPKFVLEK